MTPMFNLISILFGLVALVLAVPSFIPLLGAGNYLVIPIAMVGLLFGVISRARSGARFCLVVIVIAIIRLSLGGGIF